MYDNLEQESEIIQEVLSGKREAFSQIVDFYGIRLRSALSYYCSSPELIDELVQESFVQAYFALKNFNLDKPFFPWLKTIAMNNIRKAARHREVRMTKADDYLYYLQLKQSESEETYSNADEHSTYLKSCLEKMNEAQVKVLKKKYSENLSFKDMALFFNKKVSAMKVQIHRLRLSLKNCIEESVAHNVS